MDHRLSLFTVVFLCLFWTILPQLGAAACLDPPGDTTGDGSTSVSDVQCNILMNLWSLDGQEGPVPGCVKALGSPAVVGDHSCDGIINVADTLIAVGFALKTPLDIALDANGNQCVDACETDLDGDGDFDVTDCAPHDPQVFVGSVEYCNGLDDNCNGIIDDPQSQSVNLSCNNGDVCDGAESCVPVTPPSTLFITEWMIKPASVPTAIGQWIEIYNGGVSAQNIQGWSISDGGPVTHTIDAGGAIFVPPHGYLVLASSTNIGQNGGVKASYAFAPFQLSSGSIQLINPQGTTVDHIDYNTFVVPLGASVAVTSLQVNNNDPQWWAPATLPYGTRNLGTPGGPNTDVTLSACVNGIPPAPCNDGNPCTNDACNPLIGCVFSQNSAVCDDNNVCTTEDLCVGGACQGTTPVLCNDANPCTNDTCDPVAGCVFSPNTLPCNDNNACTTFDGCTVGDCLGTAPVTCNDTNPCTNDTCNPLIGCVFSSNSALCNDNNVCTMADLCVGGSCQGTTPVLCNDTNPCTNDTCDSVAGCVFSPNTLPCTDDNVCTTFDVCTAGDCLGTAPITCNDTNPCTDDTCQPSIGCLFSSNTAPCNDNNTCTTVDICTSGVCSGGQPLNCDDQDPCTTDSCDSQTGCFHACSCNCDCPCTFADPICAPAVSQCCTDTNDNDADGFLACDECDDTNGGVFPGAAEKCNGIDDNCDGVVDEGFDKDSDGYSPCALEPQLTDCNDNVAAVSPGAPELCGATGTGNGVDDNCNGYVDEACNNCDPTDPDGDGFSGCQGDCAPTDPQVFPGAPELCDGKDNDCNKTTRTSCDVSDPCNFNKNSTPLDDNDVCMQDLVCVCTLNATGQCSGNWQCTSFCNTSASGPVGDGCGTDQVCTLQMQASANINGCAVAISPPGTLDAGELCTTSSECRGLNCSKLCTAPTCINSYCVDVCLNDDYCPVDGTFCRLLRQTSTLNGYCWPPDGPGLGPTKLGQACSADAQCDHGFCSQTTKQCASACCTESDCPSGFYCSLLGDQIFANLVVTPANAQSCALNSQCPSALCFNGKCSYLLTETTPMCLRESAGQQNLQAGAACQQNGDCASNYCEKNLNVCVDPCCNDSACPMGLMCTAQLIEVTPDPVNGYKRTTNARVCLNLTTAAILQRK